MQIPPTLNWAFLNGKTAHHLFDFESGIYQICHKNKGQYSFQKCKLISTSVRGGRGIEKLTQTEAGIALDNCDGPFEIAPWGQRFLVFIFCWFIHATLLVLQKDISTQLLLMKEIKMQGQIPNTARVSRERLGAVQIGCGNSFWKINNDNKLRILFIKYLKRAWHMTRKMLDVSFKNSIQPWSIKDTILVSFSVLTFNNISISAKGIGGSV